MESYIICYCNLIVIRDNISIKEHVLEVIGGLDHNYSSLVTTMSWMKHDFSLDEVFSIMRTHEIKTWMHEFIRFPFNSSKLSKVLFSVCFKNYFTHSSTYSFFNITTHLTTCTICTRHYSFHLNHHILLNPPIVNHFHLLIITMHHNVVIH